MVAYVDGDNVCRQQGRISKRLEDLKIKPTKLLSNHIARLSNLPSVNTRKKPEL